MPDGLSKENIIAIVESGQLYGTGVQMLKEVAITTCITPLNDRVLF